MASASPLLQPLTARIRAWVLGAFPRGQSGIDYAHPPGDPGLFGPNSATWRIHAEFPGMLAGGLCALMLQTLHPRALAGVWDHSSFRDDLVGRLRRTTGFVAGTTYAGQAEAQRLIAHVAAIHGRVRGTTADGQPYAADDPGLLTWVHVTEAFGFLQGYRRYSPTPLPEGAADRYFDESRRVAEALGARDVPDSAAAVDAYFQQIQAELRFDARSREVLAVLGTIRLPVPAAGLSRGLFLGAGAALLPEWAAGLLRRTPAQRMQAGASARVLRASSPLFRRALSDGIAQRACARVGVPVDALHCWPAASRVRR
ncbi:oxygenase MpaB family protein [Luteimonas sp. BDR2-5]|uniref:oxygenase MpaB family protein n=1 Tax=Proluteimonas luteida TaxID=2878685 RepID=UPI001E597588|nr:oxygenase MpaB family protein [Luteimonas sp. BDR2-5]MCD9029381.1 oxygenase MpaB family protein [Luteimonas sp. BDR2-5]